MTVLEASALKIGDLNGLSDPYCMIKVGLHHFRSRTIEKTLNPVWNHSLRVYVDTAHSLIHINLRNLSRETSGLESLNLEVWDEDTFSTDDFLGTVLPFSPFT